MASSTSSVTRHVPILLEDIIIQFPFQPYDTQKDYMKSVLQAVKSSSNALLESPTGTGKTLSLLCATLGWLTHQEGAPKKTIVYYTSRTHTQLSQVAKEQKRTAYAKIPSVVLGSRSQTCLNNDVRREGADHLINRACRNAIARNACQYYSNYEQKLETLDTNQVLDIEYLGKWGKGHQCCPYYAGKKIAESKASLIMMPYNYLLDPSLNKNSTLKLERSVIIIDEAHNVDKVLKDAVSGKFTKNCLKTILDSCKDLPAKLNDALNRELHGLTRFGYDPKEKRNTSSANTFNKRSRNKNKENGDIGDKDKESKPNLIEELSSKLTNDKLQQVVNCVLVIQRETCKNFDMQQTNSIEKVFRLLVSANIEYKTSDFIIKTLDSMITFWTFAGVMNPTLVAKYVTAIQNFYNFISLIYPENCLSLVKQQEHVNKLKLYYVAYLEGIYESTKAVKDLNIGEPKDWTLNIWCLHPAIGLKRAIDSNAINGPRSMILTSGTLNPMEPIQKELDTEFKYIKQFKHVIKPDQLSVMIIGESSDSYSLMSNFQSAEKDEYKRAIGKTLLAFFRILPYGTLVIFSSYSLLEKVIKYWKEKSTIWTDMNSCTTIFVESKTQDSFLSDMYNYKRKLETRNSRAVFFGVCRGKLSEGVNLDGNECRTVIMTGLPFPNSKDPKVISTRNFHARRELDGSNIWYAQQMTRALNQTLGRVIRSKDDYGMLILCDPRFKGYRYSLSEWARPFVPMNLSKISEAEDVIKSFFEKHGQKITGSISEAAGAFEIGFNKPNSSAQLKINNNTNKNNINNSNNINLFKRNNNQTKQISTINTRKKFKPDLAPQTSTILSQITSDCEIIGETVVGVPLGSNGSTTNSQQQYSILEQYKDKNRPTNYRCFICQNEAKVPYRLNCRCAKVGCLAELKMLDKRECGKCKIELRIQDFKPIHFKSALLNKERQPHFYEIK